MSSLVQLLAQARRHGLEIDRDGGRLLVRGPRSAAPLVNAILARKGEAFAFVELYNGRAVFLDWGGEHRAQVADRPAACLLCGRKALLRDPFDGKPCHKACVEATLSPTEALATGGTAA